ncbi:MAG: superoxide dismutase family protein [Bacteroidota bacterium]
MRSIKLWALGVLAVVLTAGCAQEMEQEVTTTSTDFTKAVVVLHPTEGNDVTGTVTYEKVADGVRVSGTINGLEEGKHGFHIHEYGDCTAADGTSAGGHYNPEKVEHGAPTDEMRHIGDMGNIEANADGVAEINYVDETINLNGPHSIMGRGVIVHAGEDDLTSQPTGAAGARVACGVIGIANGQ